MMFPQWQMDMSWMAAAFVIWMLLTVVAVGALVWLIVTLSRAEDGARSAVDEPRAGALGGGVTGRG